MILRTNLGLQIREINALLDKMLESLSSGFLSSNFSDVDRDNCSGVGQNEFVAFVPALVFKF